MEQPVKIIISSSALYKALSSLNLDYRKQDDIISILVGKGKLIIDTYELDAEHLRFGSLQIRIERIVYLRGILSRVQESPIVLIINGDNLFLSEIYI